MLDNYYAISTPNKLIDKNKKCLSKVITPNILTDNYSFLNKRNKQEKIIGLFALNK